MNLLEEIEKELMETRLLTLYHSSDIEANIRLKKIQEKVEMALDAIRKLKQG